MNKTKESHVISMYLPLSRLFGFCQDISPVFRGVTHQIILKTSNFSNMIIKSGVQSSKVDVMHLSWMLLVFHPSLPIATQLEAAITKNADQWKAGLGKGSSFELRWEACNTYKVIIQLIKN